MRKSHQSSLRLLRNATGQSQEKFAAAIGTTKAIIENIEMGRSPITEHLINSIVGLTGVDPKSLGEESPRDFDGGSYSAESWERWRAFMYPPTEADELVGLAKIYL